MATRRAKVLAEDIEADIVNVVFCDRVPLAARSVKDRAHWHPVDPDTAKDLALLTAYGAGDIEFLNIPEATVKLPRISSAIPQAANTCSSTARPVS